MVNNEKIVKYLDLRGYKSDWVDLYSNIKNELDFLGVTDQSRVTNVSPRLMSLQMDAKSLFNRMRQELKYFKIDGLDESNKVINYYLDSTTKKIDSEFPNIQTESLIREQSEGVFSTQEIQIMSIIFKKLKDYSKEDYGEILRSFNEGEEHFPFENIMKYIMVTPKKKEGETYSDFSDRSLKHIVKKYMYIKWIYDNYNEEGDFSNATIKSQGPNKYEFEITEKHKEFVEYTGGRSVSIYFDVDGFEPDSDLQNPYSSDDGSYKVEFNEVDWDSGETLDSETYDTDYYSVGKIGIYTVD